MSDDLSDRIEQFQRCVSARDVAAAEGLLDEDYALVLVQPVEATVPRAAWLAMLPDYVVHDYTIDAQTIAIDGDCAAVMHRARMHATVHGEDRSGPFVVSDVWRRRDGTWRLWRRHSTPLSAGSLPGADA